MSSLAREFRAEVNSMSIRKIWNLIAALEREIQLARAGGANASQIRFLRDQLLITRHVLNSKLQNNTRLGGKRKRNKMRGGALSEELINQAELIRSQLQHETHERLISALTSSRLGIQEAERRLRENASARNYKLLDQARLMERLIVGELARRGYY